MATPAVVVPAAAHAAGAAMAVEDTAAAAAAGVGAETDATALYEETCIIFDWDDTLLSSSWLAHNGLRLDSPDVLPAEVAAQLAVLEESVCNLLERALCCGTVLIITNAEHGWVELSCLKFIPRVQPLLKRLKVLSARTTFEPFYPDSPSEWKLHAFFQEILATYSGRHPAASKNVLSFGDSVHERAAVHKVTSVMGPTTRTKSVKFVERPTVEQLKRQVDLVASCFYVICRHPGCLDLMLTIQLLASPTGTGAGAATAGGDAAAAASGGAAPGAITTGAAAMPGGY